MLAKQSKRGFFIFEPVIVLVFLGALLSASFISLAKYDFLQQPVSSHADTLVETYLSSETDVFLAREMQARKLVETTIYSFAGNECKLHGLLTTLLPERIAAQAFVSKESNARFGALLSQQFNQQVPYEFIVQDPLVVVGIPLQPESIPIEIPSDVRKTGVGRIAEYPARVSFTLPYSYALQETYDEITNDVAALQSCVNAQNEAGRADCITQKLKTFNTERLHWKLTHEDDSPVYDLDIEHQYQAPLCLNKPLTLLTIKFPPITQSTP